MEVLILFICLLGMIVLGVAGIDMRPGMFSLWALLILVIMIVTVIVFC